MNFKSLDLRTALLISAYFAAFLGVNLSMKFASLKTGTPAYWWWFVGGNLVGFFCTLFMVMAMKDQNPHLIYALCIGGGFCLLQVACFLIFREPLSAWQWAGIGLVGTGIICLQIQSG
jgi:multidrug transporter EmrE-like cation transporter